MITITNPSAMKFWLYEDPSSYTKSVAPQSSNTQNSPANIPFSSRNFLAAQFSAQWNLPLPLHILVSKPSQRKETQTYKCHLNTISLPSESFVKINEQAQIISPELCFLLAAKTLTLSQLVLFACDLCGIYSRTVENELGLRRRPPVTNVDKIKTYLKKIKGFPGIRKARQAIQYALDRSNSPRESLLAVLSMLSFSLGGYRLLPPSLNFSAYLSADIAKITGLESCNCDLVWPEQKLIVEYNSNLTHLDSDQHYKDTNRANVLMSSGYKLITITNNTFSSLNLLDNTFAMIRKDLGMKKCAKELMHYRKKRYSVVQELITFQYSFT